MGTTQQVTVTGTGFVPAAGLQVRVRSTGFSVGGVESSSATAIVVPVRVAASTAPGRFDVVVINPDGGQGTCVGCLTVTPPG